MKMLIDFENEDGIKVTFNTDTEHFYLVKLSEGGCKYSAFYDGKDLALVGEHKDVAGCIGNFVSSLFQAVESSLQ